MDSRWDEFREGPEWHRVIRVDQLQRGQMRLARVGVRQVVVAEASGGYRVFRNACPHAGAPLSGGNYTKGVIECPRHHWKFDVTTGLCAEHPLYSLRLYETRVEDGWVMAREAEEEIW